MSERGDMAEPLVHGDDFEEPMIEAAEASHDEDDRLKPEYLTAVLDAVEDGDDEKARELVSPLHPADIADLLELAPSDRRADVAAALFVIDLPDLGGAQRLRDRGLRVSTLCEFEGA